MFAEEIEVQTICHAETEDTVTGHNRIFHGFRRNFGVDENNIIYNKNYYYNNDDHFYIIPDFIPDFHNYTPLNVLLLIYVEIALVKLPQNVFRTGYAIFLQVQEKSGDKHGEADVSAHNDHGNID